MLREAHVRCEKVNQSPNSQFLISCSCSEIAVNTPFPKRGLANPPAYEISLEVNKTRVCFLHQHCSSTSADRFIPDII